MHRREDVHKGKHKTLDVKQKNSKSANVKIWFFRVYSNLIILKLEAFLPEYFIYTRRVYICLQSSRDASNPRSIPFYVIITPYPSLTQKSNKI